MTTLLLTGWRPGLKKVSLTQTLRTAGLTLGEAKVCTDRLLDGEEVLVTVAGDEVALAVLEAVRNLGADAILLP